MKRIITTLALVFIVGSSNLCFGWGRDAHAAIAYIAERHLTPTAKANIEKCIDGNSIVYYASWLDNHRAEHKSWSKLAHVAHYNVDTCDPIGRPYKQMKETINKLKKYQELPDSALKVSTTLFTLLVTTTALVTSLSTTARARNQRDSKPQATTSTCRLKIPA